MAIKRSFTLVTLCLAGLCFAPVAQAEPNTAAREAIEDAIAKCNFTLGAPSQEAALAKRMADNHVNPETLRLRQDQWKDLRAQAVAIDPAIVNFAGNVGDYGAVKVRVAYCDRAYDVAIAAVVAADEAFAKMQKDRDDKMLEQSRKRVEEGEKAEAVRVEKLIAGVRG